MFEPFSRRNSTNPKADAYIYDTLPQPLKVQIIHIWEDVMYSFLMSRARGTDPFYAPVAQALYKARGVFQLVANSRSLTEEVCGYFLNERDVAKCLDVIEFTFDSLVAYVQQDSYVNFDWMQRIRQAAMELNSRFKEHSVGFEFKDGKMIRIDSAFIHSETVIPAFALLQEPYLSGANQEFQKAHEHFRHGRYGESINECLKSFESTMKAICYKRSWHYDQNDTAKKLLDVCEKNGLFPTFMQSSLGGLRSVLENVATFRNKLSGHGQGVKPVQITQEVAAFVIHSTAANILFLASLERLIP